ncbi:MAG: hypothetical protein ACKVT2_02765 [Saprospiraceae bacterium]
MACNITILSVLGTTDDAGVLVSVTVQGTAQDCTSLKVTLVCSGHHVQETLDNPDAIWSVTFADPPGCICDNNVIVKAECEGNPSCTAVFEDELDCLCLEASDIGVAPSDCNDEGTEREMIFTFPAGTAGNLDYGDGNNAGFAGVMLTHFYIPGVYDAILSIDGCPDISIEVHVPECLPTGACCFKDKRCQLLTEAECIEQGGEYLGDGKTCDECPPPLTGACCFKDGHCEEGLTEEECRAQSGEYRGNGTTCADCPPPPTGACCLPDGTCELLTQRVCELERHGEWKGPDSTCADCPPPPPPTGACCFTDRPCALLTEEECRDQGGEYRGNDTMCADCPPTGACCFTDRPCALLTEEECRVQGGEYRGNDTTCADCPPTDDDDDRSDRGGCLSVNCATLLYAAISALIIASILAIIGCYVPVILIVAIIAGIVALMLFGLWALFCYRFTPCWVMRRVQCFLWWMVARIIPGILIIEVVLLIFGVDICPLLATLAAAAGWAFIYANLNDVMRRVDCERICP